MNTIKYLLTNFESIRCRYNNNLVHKYISESVNPAADADFSMFYEDTALGATSCMTVCMILQLALTDLINMKKSISYQTEDFFRNKLDYFINKLEKTNLDYDKLKEFFVYNDKLDQSRQIALKDYIPELEQCRNYLTKQI